MTARNIFNELSFGDFPAGSSTVPYKAFKVANLPLLSWGPAVPTAGTAGFAKSCLFLLTTATGATNLLSNNGTGTSCKFVDVST